MAKAGDPNHGPGETFDYNPNDTQPTRTQKQVDTPQPQNYMPSKKNDDSKQAPTFNWGSLILLIVLIWGAEWLGTTIPGPVDDMLYDAIAALFFGFIQYLRALLYKK